MPWAIAPIPAITAEDAPPDEPPDDTQSFELGTTVLTKPADGIDWDPVTRQFSDLSWGLAVQKPL